MPVNTAALKTFAPAMRRQLLEAVGRKLDLLLNSQTPDTLSTFAKQIAELREQEGENRDQLLERVAYTWFNRLCALRYLDGRGWHPFGCKVLMPAAEGETQPELLKLMRAGNLPAALQSHTDQARLHGLLDGQIQTALAGADPQGEVYRQLVLAVCRCYHELLPNLFEGLDDASELLLPDDLLSDGSIVGAFRKEITDDDCQDVESLGWLYQFYIAEKKDEVMARKKAVPTEDIPAVTQLFTPHWIVRYLVENSLGRLWLLNRPASKLRDQMPYYIKGDAETDFLVINKPEEIKLLDPACGSGHMLTYAFDLLVLIYEEEGYSPNEIPGLILKNNLHGLEICPRAAQLAELALVFKAREQSRRFFQPEQLVRPQIIEMQDVQFEDGELNDYIKALDLGELFDPSLFKLLRQFEEAKNFGSLIQPCLDEKAIADVRRAIEAKDLGGQLFLRETHLKVLRVLEQADALTQRYHVVVANPPYMGGKQMNQAVKEMAKTCFPNSKSDLFAVFIERAFGLSQPHGYVSMVTMQSWMFLSSYELLRHHILTHKSIVCMAHLGARAFDSIAGEVVQSTAFVLQNIAHRTRIACFVRLTDGNSEKEKASQCLAAVADEQSALLFRACADTLLRIPGQPIAYWMTEQTIRLFTDNPSLGSLAMPRKGNTTTNNDRFLRSWSEVSLARLGIDLPAYDHRFKWIPYNKGGGYRKWFGMNGSVVNWSNNGAEIKAIPHSVVASESLYFQTGLTWSTVSAGRFSVRYFGNGFIFDNGGCCLFSDDARRLYFLALMNSAIFEYLLSKINPTVNFQSGEIAKLPVISLDSINFDLDRNTLGLVNIARADWNNFETSWDFRDQPLLRPGLKGATLEASWRNWDAQSTAAIRRMQGLETENNRLFIAAYGLEGELQPEVPEEQITLARADQGKDIAAFLSYATGCMMGRYSQDQPGLILADSRDSQAAQLAAYEDKVGKPIAEVQFKPDPDGIIPVLDGEWFEDDTVARTREFLAVTFPESSVGENLRFIEESLGKDIRKYFCSEFYKDHLQTYKKRPIYWMVQSPKKGFACLIYLHRYTKDTLNQVLNNYFRPYLQKLEARQAQLGPDQLNDDLPTRERTAARKEAEKITKVLKECQAWEQDALLPLAQQRIELDLDDGVKVNYLKLQDVLAPIPGLAAKED
ncbi:BREX-1 system adenine-specific DNA-methyltransferase PglX [Cyanobium sp. Aljojuca 7D2]|uniref:BREX-1 system adenine-specific DNA-methyltransferase PglX n=1 Tax=Cyanobium sp. Aljojuca 7D2 TaxID=2823698 RepID=UPI0020CC2A02|nr:BREX-1 system adenine-specific DNA-methyltransferase PglX [Cyanobium sp. Aljojuca 7D2]MCP9891413.1 BREX-1 system adenine-specific DNA-methyltransferase PglX [Cyanobium sp. Aljojuca 7D2]